MTKNILRFMNILMSGLIAGTLFGICIGFNPQNLTAPTYVEQQQSTIKALNTLMPILGLVTIILIVISAIMQRDSKRVFITLLTAAVLLIISGLVTRFGNQPINSVVLTWNQGNIPTNWTELRDKWWSFHLTRSLTSVASFCLVIWAGIKKN